MKHPLTHFLRLVAASLAGLAIGAGAWAQTPAPSVTYTFNAPATGLSSQNPPYPSVVTLTLTQTQNGVDFLLKPQWTDPAAGFSSQSFFEKLDFVYKGDPLSNSNFSFLDGQAVSSFKYQSGATMDSGYKAADQHILVDWSSSKNGPQLNAATTSSWSISGVTLSNFTSTQATSSAKPSPTFGVISVTSYSLTDPKPTPSNWVTDAAISPIPEPSTYALMAMGLVVMVSVARRRSLPRQP